MHSDFLKRFFTLAAGAVLVLAMAACDEGEGDEELDEGAFAPPAATVSL